MRLSTLLHTVSHAMHLHTTWDVLDELCRKKSRVCLWRWIVKIHVNFPNAAVFRVGDKSWN